MKYLFTFSVVAPPISRQIPPVLESESQGDIRLFYPKRVEEIILTAMNETPDAVAYFRSVLDGWDAAHRMLLPWIEKHRPNSETVWEEFYEKGVLILEPDEVAAIGLDGVPKKREINKILRHHPYEAYAIRAFIAAWEDAVSFVRAAKVTMVFTARPIGVSCDDSEYAGMMEGE